MSGNENTIPLEENENQIDEQSPQEEDNRNIYMTNEPLTNNMDSSFGR